MSFYITTPIFYVNDVPHIGHGYTLVVSDVFARWGRQSGQNTFFLTGTDEHGLKVLRAASEKGMSPQKWTDFMVETSWKPLLELLHISNDDFIRTTEPRHQECVKWFIDKLRANGYIYQGEYSGYYCVSCEEFKASDEQDCICEIHGSKLEYFTEKNYFFRLGEFADRLLDLYEKNPGFIEPKSAYNEVVQLVKSGISDLSISRSSFTWGIDVPWDGGHVVYVWFDALINYVTAVVCRDAEGGCVSEHGDGSGVNRSGGIRDGSGVDVLEDGGQSAQASDSAQTTQCAGGGDTVRAYAVHRDAVDEASLGCITRADDLAKTDARSYTLNKYWPAHHVIGKDILRFHAVIWPAMLMAAGLPVPKKVLSHGWLLVDGQKMSKSKLTGIAPRDLTNVFGVDATRYYFLRQPVFGQDYSFSMESIAACYKSELADGYGNLACRLSSMYATYLDGRVVVPEVYSDDDRQLLQACRDTVEKACEAMSAFAPHVALAEIWSLAVAANVHITKQQPWNLHKNGDNIRLLGVLYSALRALSTVTVLLSPVIPHVANSLWNAFGVGDVSRQDLRRAHEAELLDRISLIPPLFPKIDLP